MSELSGLPDIEGGAPRGPCAGPCLCQPHVLVGAFRGWLLDLAVTPICHFPLACDAASSPTPDCDPNVVHGDDNYNNDGERARTTVCLERCLWIQGQNHPFLGAASARNPHNSTLSTFAEADNPLLIGVQDVARHVFRRPALVAPRHRRLLP